MNSLSNLPLDLRNAIYDAWDPEAGLTADAIRALLIRVGAPVAAIAMEAGVDSHYVHHVCRRIRRSPRVEGQITARLATLGLSHEIIWGTRPPKRPSVRALPEGLDDLPPFQGRLLSKVHGVLLLVDCETTGLDANRHAVLELALARVVYHLDPSMGRRLLGVLDGYTGLQDPGQAPVDPMSMRVNRISLDLVRGQRIDTRRVQKLLAGCSAIVAHNASFDFRFLTRLFPFMDDRPWHCTFRGLPWKSLGFESASLKSLATTLGLPNPTHRAAGDLQTLYRLLDAPLPDGLTVLAHLLNSPIP